MRRTTTQAILAAIYFSTSALFGTSINRASAEEQIELEKNNSWKFEISNKLQISSPLFITLKQEGAHWAVAGIYETPPDIPRTQKSELFVATRDLQTWGNFYINSVANCYSFEAKQADFHSVCTSSLSEKQSSSSAIVGVFFGGNASRPTSYNLQKVKAAIQSIRVEQAAEMLSAHEQNTTVNNSR